MASFNNPRRLKELEESAKRRKMKSYEKLLPPSLEEKILSAKQHKAIQLLTDFMNNWSPDYIAGQCGVTVAMIHRWKHDPFFLYELDKEITRRKTTYRLEAYKQLFRMIKKPRVLLAYLKMTGDFTEKIEIADKNVDELQENELDREINRIARELSVSGTEASNPESKTSRVTKAQKEEEGSD